MKEKKNEKNRRSTRILISIAVILCLCASAMLWKYFNNAAEPVFEKLQIVSGSNSCVIPQQDFKISVMALSDDGSPMPGVKVSAKAAPGSCSFEKNELITNPGGVATFNVKSLRRIGENEITFSANGKPETLRFINGVQISEVEGQTGETKPVSITLYDADRKPRSNVEVFVSTSGGASTEVSSVRTDKNGVASVKVTLPKKSGVSNVQFEVQSPNETFRAIQVKVMAVNSWNILISVLGGLAIFMLGMTMMSDGLSNIAGEKMKSFLGYCTSNRFLALLTGAGVTAVIQSSSATTVMIIGFVNAGLMNLAQSIGVIFGANIGTTITAQIIAFNIGAVALPAVVIGVLMRFIKRGKLPEIGLTVLGFGLLFFGMNLMSGEMKILSELPSFKNFFTIFDCAPQNGIMPFAKVAGAILLGLVATLVMQSSSATTGVVVVLGANGLIDLYTAVALILGANIGTTITAQLAAIPANRLARQAAMAHTLFNLLGVFMVVGSFWIPWRNTGTPVFFYAVNAITAGDAFAVPPENMARHIANAHTLFNIATSIILLPFTGLLAKICEKLLPQREAKIHFQYLEPHLLDSPALALKQSTVALAKMLKKSWKMVDSAVSGNFIPGKVNENRMEKFNNREERVDRYQTEIMEYLAQVMRRKLSPSQAETIPLLMHCVNDAERIADRAENIINLTRRLEAENLTISRSAIDELDTIFVELSKQTGFALNALESSDELWKQRAVKSEERINELAALSEDAHIKRIRNGKCTAQTGIIYVELLAELVAVSRHLSNIAERAV